MNRSPRRMRKSTVDTGAAQGHIRSAGHASARTLDAIAILLAGLALTLLLKRYAGIQHDAVLYLGEGLLRRSPAIFSEDLAFVHGNGQGRFTLFPTLLNLALQHWNPAPIFMWGALASILLFAGTSWFAVRCLCEPGSRFWTWLGVTCLPATYGYGAMFKYNEPFLTPRPLAESLCLVAIGLVALKRHALAALALVAAGLLHPLQTIAVLPLLYCYAVRLDRRWLHLAWLAVALLALAWPLRSHLPLDPFLVIDDIWLIILKDNTGQLFLRNWAPESFQAIALDLVILGYATTRTRPSLAPLCAAAAVGLVLALTASFLLVDTLQLALPTGLQLWRAHWITHWLAMAMAATLAWQDVHARDVPRALLLMLVLLLTRNMVGFAWIVLIGLYIAWPKLIAQGTVARLRPVLGWLFAIGIATLFASYMLLEWGRFHMAHYRLDLYAIDRRLLLFPLVPFGLSLLGFLLWQRIGKPTRVAVIALALLPLTAIAALRWDARPPLVLATERHANTPDIFGTPLPQDAQVFWLQWGVLETWLVLNRASYYSPYQVAGQIFNRDLSFDANRRAAHLSPLMLDEIACEDLARPERDRALCKISNEGLHRACAPPTGRGPDYLVLPYRQSQAARGTWSIEDPMTGENIITWRLYACTDLLREPAIIGSQPSAR